ncbi:hypothetical protein FNH13_02355 [Ornithinimicrobium ciconiae]|uniref:DUF4188 domain-containing protein n=1 Tax=Ornithinimicrobium ciconiae TaxID=2594265 RepID=A0A516G709_9MICO|nr:hypothetical protein [Ornithinimicrobium ciconiae]QDO87316.1 hypothetical protein FNH13_02355 [Ornithinimicrobium ciconiae]
MRMPRVGHAGAVFVGATRYTGPLAWLRLAPGWVRMVRQMKTMPGYVYHRVYYEPPFSLGTLGFFETQDDLMRFARTGQHRELMQWVVGERNATGGYIRVFHATAPRTGEAPPAEGER